MRKALDLRSVADVLESRLLMAATTSTFGAAADSYVRDGSYAGSNFGTATELDVKVSGTDFNRETLLRFDISSAGSTVTSAKLRLYGALQDTRAVNVVTNVYGTS